MLNNYKCRASVVIPVYNQLESLKYTLKFFDYQSCSNSDFEVIVINDGSTDGLENLIVSELEIGYQLKIINQRNLGRAAARNTGIRNSIGDIIIFCDADRIPDNNFITRHINLNDKHRSGAIIGASYDYFGGLSRIKSYDTNDIYKYSRLPQYYKKVMTLYENKITKSSIAWITFLVGNASVKKEIIVNAGLFNEKFQSWGFEHFELAIRLLDNNVELISDIEVMNFHIPHRRDKSYILEQYRTSGEILRDLHPSKKVNLLNEFLCGEISLYDFEKEYSNNSTTVTNLSSVYFNL